MLFTVTYTAYSGASPDAVWKTLTDIESWPTWDARLERTSSDGPLRAGSKYTLNPVHGNEVTIDVVKAEGYNFNDRAKLDLGTVETERSVTPLEGGSLITQTMRADIEADSARAFGLVFWDSWSQGMIDSTKALANKASQQTQGKKQPYASGKDVENLLSRHRNAASAGKG
ncbi:MAG TPA: SRPBCC family protein [Pyrinomonadaceae bacterium]|jgi:hypothetical protein